MVALPQAIRKIRSFTREELHDFVVENIGTLLEDEALAALDNPYCYPHLCDIVAQSTRLTAFYSVRLRLVMHRATPRAHALKLVHYLHWPDQLRLSVDVTVAPPVRRAIDNHMLMRAPELTAGERIASARRCSTALIKHFLTDPDERVFAALLVNPRLREEELLSLASSSRATSQQLQILSDDQKWSQRRAIRKAIVMNPAAPRAAAAAQLLHLSRHDLRMIYTNPSTSLYLRRCIERLRSEVPAAERSLVNGAPRAAFVGRTPDLEEDQAK